MNPEFLKALLALKADIGPVVKDAVAKGKDGKAKYKYVELSAVHEAIDGPLAKHGFFLFHRFQEDSGDSAVIETRLVHEHGEIISTLPLGMKQLEFMNYYQSMGSAITYLRRYAIMAMLGIPAEDDDGQSARARAAPPPQPPVSRPQPTQEELVALGKRFYAGESYHIGIPANGGDKPDYGAWAGKYATMASLAPTLDAFQKLQEDNAETLQFVREKCATAVKMKVSHATEKRLGFLQQQPAMAE